MSDPERALSSQVGCMELILDPSRYGFTPKEADSLTGRLLDRLFEVELLGLEAKINVAMSKGEIQPSDFVLSKKETPSYPRPITKTSDQKEVYTNNIPAARKAVMCGEAKIAGKAAYYAAKEGDYEPLVNFFDIYVRRNVTSYLFYKFGFHLEKADEVIQSMWLRALPGMKKFKIEDIEIADLKLRSWFYRITHNLAVDELRTADQACNIDEYIEDTSFCLRSSFGPDDMQELMDHREVRHALVLLESDWQRQSLMLKYIIGARDRVIARILKKDPGCVRSLLHRGKASMMRRIVKEGKIDYKRFLEKEKIANPTS